MVFRSWPSIQRWLPKQSWFDDYFVVTEGAWDTESTGGSAGGGGGERIPYQLLREPAADEMYRNHVNSLRAQHRRAE